ncbi:unnamed protein product [Rotaria sp. Silwood1]|nr:unnamed protein product [Rotaria sp. Silwood1]
MESKALKQLGYFPQLPLTTTVTDNQTTTDSASGLSHETRCLDELEQVKAIFDMFVSGLKRISTEWKQLPISQLISLFPDLHFIDDDFQTIESLFDDSTIPSLRRILDYWKDHRSIDEICHSVINLLKYLKLTSDNDKSPLTERMLTLNEETPGEICWKTYNEYCTLYTDKFSEKALNFIKKFNISNELLDFIHPLTSTDIESLLESINDSDEILIDTSTILNMTKIKSFFERIYEKVAEICRQSLTPAPEEIVIQCLENLLNEEEFTNIVSYIDSSLHSLTSILRMYMELTNKGLSKRQRILEIMQTSQMRFIEQRKTQYGNDKHQFDIKIMIKEQTLSTVEQTSIMVREKVVERPITYIDLHELRDRARLIEYSSSEEKKLSEEERNRLQSFVKMVELIETILKNLTSLNLSGHPFVSEYLKPERRFRCDAGNFNELENMSEELQQLQTEWNDYLLKKYQDYISLTYFSHQQIWLVEEYLYGEETESKNPFSYHFMKLIGINISLIDTKLLPKKANKPEERLENIGRILNTAHILTMIESSSKSDTNKIVFLVGTSDEGILRAILSIFQLYKMPPKYNHLFYCTSATSWIEIRAFVYRCFYSKNSLHQLIRPEQLSLSVQDQFTNLIREVIKNNPEHSFRLAVITTAPTDQLQLINSLKILQIVQTVSNHELLNEEKLKNEVEKLIGNNCYLVTSSISGLGKSIYIQDEIQCMNKEYIKFPISGNFDIDTIAERLLQKTTQLLSLQAAIHLDIGIIDNIQEFNEFLYCLLIFRAFRSRHTAITIPVDLPIFIEFDSSPSSIRMTSKVVVLQYLSRQHFDRINWNQLKIENRLNTLYVVKCLKAFEDQTIINQNIERNEDQLRTLTVEECITHLQNHFLKEKNKDFVTWTQLNIYTSIYNTIFSGFSQCGHFMVFNDEEQEQSSLRIHILRILLNSSNQFTSLSVENVRNKQRSVDTSDISLSDAIVRWDKTEPFTVIFSDSYDPLFVYKTVDDIPDSLRIKFGRFHEIERRSRRQRMIPRQLTTQEPELLPDYKDLKHEELFLKLAYLSKKYYHRPICPKCFQQYDSTIKNCTKCATNNGLCWAHELRTDQMEKLIKAIGNNLKTHYVLTADNYIKMLLIYLRIQSNIPVLIMGETGINL